MNYQTAIANAHSAFNKRLITADTRDRLIKGIVRDEAAHNSELRWRKAKHGY